MNGLISPQYKTESVTEVEMHLHEAYLPVIM